MKVVVKTIQEDLDEQIEKLTAESKKIACIEMTSAELEQLKKELEPLLHFEIKRVGQGNKYRGHKIKIVEPKKNNPCPRCGGSKHEPDDFSKPCVWCWEYPLEVKEGEKKLGSIGPFGVYENPCLPKDKVIFTSLPKQSGRSLLSDMFDKMRNKEIKLPESNPFEWMSEFDNRNRENRLIKEAVRLGQVADELRNDYVQSEKDKAIMRDALMSIQHLTKTETGSVAIQCNQWSTSALDQVKP